MIKNSLQPLPADDRDINLGALVKYPKLDELPEEFSLGDPLWIGDQNAAGEDDMCTGYATCGSSQYQESERLYPAFSFAASKAISGGIDEWGQDLRSAMKAHQKYGAVKFADITVEEAALEPKARRDFANYSEGTKSRAQFHSKDAYATCKGPYDAYDNIRSAIWLYRDQKRAPVIGVVWSWNLIDYILDAIGFGGGFGHAMYVTGWSKEGLIVVNSAGLQAGKNGMHRMTRKVVDQYVPIYGAYMHTDIPVEEARRREKEYVSGIVASNLSANGLIQYFFSFWLRFFNVFGGWMFGKNVGGTYKGNWLQEILWAIFSVFFAKPVEPEKEEPPKPEPEPKKSLLDVAKGYIGGDASPDDGVPDELGCVESLSVILANYFGVFPKLTSTVQLYEYLGKDKRFVPTLDLSPGNIILCVTGTGNGSIPHGHCGIIGENGTIMSNDSRDGIWRSNYTINSWIARFREKGAMKIRVFEAL